MKTALLVIDVQMAFIADDESGAERSCREAESNIAKLLSCSREAGTKVVHIHHHGTTEDDPFYGQGPGAEPQQFAAPLEGEAVYIKQVGSGFTGTSLESDLRAEGIDRLVLCGATANHCAESTTRSAGDLGFDSYYVADAVWAYAHTGPDGVFHSAEQIHSSTLCTLHGEFATVVKAAEASELLKG